MVLPGQGNADLPHARKEASISGVNRTFKPGEQAPFRVLKLGGPAPCCRAMEYMMHWNIMESRRLAPASIRPAGVERTAPGDLEGAVKPCSD